MLFTNCLEVCDRPEPLLAYKWRLINGSGCVDCKTLVCVATECWEVAARYMTDFVPLKRCIIYSETC